MSLLLFIKDVALSDFNMWHCAFLFLMLSFSLPVFFFHALHSLSLCFFSQAESLLLPTLLRTAVCCYT